MDVHDVGARTTPLQAGMAFTIEPGIYIREAALDNLAKTPENAAFIEKVRATVQKYKNIGVRVEDSFLLTDTGLENLSAGVPRTDRRDRTVPQAGDQHPSVSPRILDMSRSMKRLLLVTVCLMVVARRGRAVVFGSRALIGPRSRPLTNRTFEADAGANGTAGGICPTRR